MEGAAGIDPAAPPDPFEAQAAAAGLVVPKPRRLNSWLAIGLVAVIVGASIGVGALTGWAIGPRQAPALGVYGADACAHAPSYLSTNISTAVSTYSDPTLEAALGAWSEEFSAWSGGCVHVAGNESTGDGYVPELAAATVDLVLTDLGPNATDRAALPAATDLFPEAVAPIAVVYHLSGLPAPLRLNGGVLAGIYNGSITSWSDPAIVALNPGVDLAGLPPIAPLYRAGPVDANSEFTQYLADGSPAWNESVGSGAAVAWPAGWGAASPSEMDEAISSTPGAIGYVEATGPLPANASAAALENPAGRFVLPSAAGATAAATARENRTAVAEGNWSAVSLVDSPGAASYPIDELLFSAVYQEIGHAYSDHLSATNATWMLTFLWWLATDAGSGLSALGFGPLPTPYVMFDQKGLEAVTFNGGPLLENDQGSEGGETGEF